MSSSFNAACFGLTDVQYCVTDSLFTDARNASISGTPGGGRITAAVVVVDVVDEVVVADVVVGDVVVDEVVVGEVVVGVPEAWFK